MDKVKLYLTVLKKHHFWVLCGVVTLCGLVSWWIGANSLKEAAAANTATVKGAFSKVSGVTDLANPSFAAAVDKAHDELKKQAFAVWQRQYGQQQDLLRWPSHLDKVKFIDVVQKLRPDEQIPEVQRKLYANTIFPEAWERLHDLIDMRRAVPINDNGPPMVQPAGAPTASEPPAVEWVGIVEWSLGNREELEDRYKFDPTSMPSNVKVRLTQEDLWVLEDMAVVIAKTNARVSEELKVTLDAGNAAVKKIESLDVAQWAIAAAQHDKAIVWLPKGSTLSESAAGGLNPTPPPTDVALSATALEAQADERLKDGRYLDDNGEPLLASLIATPPYAEFKQLFIRMRLVVDQRRVPELLAACANAPLPIEVRRLRIQVINEGTGSQATPPAGHGGGMSFGSTGKNTGGSYRHGDADASPRRPTSAQQAGDGAVEPGPFDVDLELCGVVTLYNRPDEEALGKGTAAEPGKKVTGIPTNPVAVPVGLEGQRHGETHGRQ